MYGRVDVLDEVNPFVRFAVGKRALEELFIKNLGSVGVRH